MKGIFGSLFDFNRDGEVDLFERTAEYTFLNELLSEEECEEEDDDDEYDEDEDYF